MFLWSLLIVIGTSLMNCTNKNGTKQKIDSVEIVDSTSNKTTNIIDALPKTEIKDTTSKKTCSTIPKPTEIIDGLIITETLGEPVIIENPAPKIDSITVPDLPKMDYSIMGDLAIEPPITIGFITIESPPEFKNTPKNLNTQEKRDYFSNQVSEIVSKNFNTSICKELTGKQKIFYTQFTINQEGQVTNIKTRAPHPDLEKETERVINLLPQFIPAKQANRPKAIVYSLPIVFTVED